MRRPPYTQVLETRSRWPNSPFNTGFHCQPLQINTSGSEKTLRSSLFLPPAASSHCPARPLRAVRPRSGLCRLVTALPPQLAPSPDGLTSASCIRLSGEEVTYEESGHPPESNPFAGRAVRICLGEVRDAQAKARGIPYKKKKRKRTQSTATGEAFSSAASSAAIAAARDAAAAAAAAIGGGEGSSGTATATTTPPFGHAGEITGTTAAAPTTSRVLIPLAVI